MPTPIARSTGVRVDVPLKLNSCHTTQAPHTTAIPASQRLSRLSTARVYEQRLSLIESRDNRLDGSN